MAVSGELYDSRTRNSILALARLNCLLRTALIFTVVQPFFAAKRVVYPRIVLKYTWNINWGIRVYTVFNITLGFLKYFEVSQDTSSFLRIMGSPRYFRFPENISGFPENLGYRNIFQTFQNIFRKLDFSREFRVSHDIREFPVSRGQRRCFPENFQFPREFSNSPRHCKNDFVQLQAFQRCQNFGRSLPLLFLDNDHLESEIRSEYARVFYGHSSKQRTPVEASWVEADGSACCRLVQQDCRGMENGGWLYRVQFATS